MSQSVLNDVLKKIKLKYPKDNEILFRYGDNGEHFFIIMKGEVSVLIPTNLNYAKELVSNYKILWQTLSRIRNEMLGNSKSIK